MSVETATYIADLQAVNPPSSDPRSQGDDHLRLLKQVLQNQFPGANRPRPIETAIAGVAVNTTLVKGNDQALIFVNTGGGAVTLTLPSLLGGDAGWQVSVIKYSNDANPVFVAPPSGNLFSGPYSVAKARRCVPGVWFLVVWNGSAWFVGRTNTLPPGSMVDFSGSSLPAGYEWPNGQTLGSVATNYPEYNSAVGSGVTLDMRGRVAVTLDNLGGSVASRVTVAGSGVDGTILGANGGAQNITIARANLPNVNVSCTVTDPGHSHQTDVIHAPSAGGNFLSGTNGGSIAATAGTSAATTGISVAFNLNGNVAQTTIGALQPSIMCSKILVVE